MGLRIVRADGMGSRKRRMVDVLRKIWMKICAMKSSVSSLGSQFVVSYCVWKVRGIGLGDLCNAYFLWRTPHYIFAVKAFCLVAPSCLVICFGWTPRCHSTRKDPYGTCSRHFCLSP